jgi:hypothetical protein
MRVNTKLSVLLVLAFFCSSCSYYRESFSILESIPYVNQNQNVSPDLIDGASHVGLGIGADFTNTSADPDTSISAFSPTISVRARPFPAAEFGFTSSFVVREGEALPYGIFDVKLGFSEEPVLIVPDVGLGLGYGYASFMWDMRTSLVVGVPLLGGQVIPYVAPRFTIFTYPYEKSGYVILTPEWASCALVGFDIGTGFSFPVMQKEDGPQHLKLRPHFTWLVGKEPKLEKRAFQVIQFGANMVYAF